MGRIERRIPEWIRYRIPSGANYTRIKKIIRDERLHTVCTEARCPNIGECLCKGTATFLILGDRCTRHCRYCAVQHGRPLGLDKEEPERVARAIGAMGLSHAVITSVTRDDLPDGGAGIFARTVGAVRGRLPSCRVELLIPDFMHSVEESLSRVIAARPDVIGHNIEVVRNLFNTLRPQGDYGLSLKVLQRISGSGIPAKSGLMIGFGETPEDIRASLHDLREAGCSLLTVGQYLRSRRDGVPVEKFYTPEEFEGIASMARALGFSGVIAGPMVRSSYHAAEMLE